MPFPQELSSSFAEWRKDLLSSRVTNDAIAALTLNLIAAIFIDDAERTEMPQELHGIGASKMTLPTRQHHPTYLRLLDAIREVLEEVRRAADEVFNQIVGRSQVQLVDLELALNCLVFPGNSDDQEQAHMSITPQYRHALGQTSIVVGANKCVHMSVKPSPEVGETASSNTAELERRSNAGPRDCNAATIDLFNRDHQNTFSYHIP
ncbi:hypothetical protein BDR03DRAFT_1018205 [Suillus americanus]|nr:hypothetical protein BDR03DRAFT_1018205 [Suillus americanus]